VSEKALFFYLYWKTTATTTTTTTTTKKTKNKCKHVLNFKIAVKEELNTSLAQHGYQSLKRKLQM